MIIVDGQEATRRRGRRTDREREAIQARSITARTEKHAKSAVGRKTRCAISLRMSMETDESMGFDAQDTQVYELIRQRGFDINDPEIEFVVFRDTESAWHRNERFAFDQMIEEIKQGLFTDVFFYHTDRFTRNSDLSGVVVPILRDSGIRIHATNLPAAFDLSDFAHRTMWDMFVNMAEYEGTRISERQINSQAERAALGFKRGGTAAVGMIEAKAFRPGWKVERHIFVPNDNVREDYPAEFPTEALFVRELFRRAYNGDGLSAITQWVNNMKFPTVSGHNKLWVPRTIGCVLRNPVYVGHSTYKGDIVITTEKDADGNDVPYRVHMPLITDELFEGVQAQLKSRSTGPRPKRIGYRLAGAVVCSRCGEKMVGKAAFGRAVRVYSCNTRLSDKTVCSGNQISADGVEKVVHDLIKAALANPAEYSRLTTRPDDEQLRVIDTQRADLLARIAKLDVLIANSDDDDATAGLENQRAKLFTEVATLDNKHTDGQRARKSANDGIGHFDSIWANDDNRIACQIFVNAVFDKIAIKPSGGVILNQHQLQKLGWPTNLDRLTIKYTNGDEIDLGEDFRRRAAEKG